MGFPANFIWGAATASYQIEGAAKEDGRSESVWDVFSSWPGKTANGESGAVACNHYHRYQEDVNLMQTIGLQAYRLSTAWPRILPNGRGTLNIKGLDFYKELIDSLLEAKIQPWITLFHWDMPQILQQEGGWLNPATADAFAEYAYIMAKSLGDRVTNWMTFNEPQCFLGLGLESGIHAPGLRLSKPDLITAHHNHLVAHGKAVDALRSVGGNRFSIGYVPTTTALIPASEDPSLVAATEKAFFSYNDSNGVLWTMGSYTDPVFLGTYPQDWLDAFESYIPKTWEADLKKIVGKTDFCGINLYSGVKVRFAKDSDTKLELVPFATGNPKTALKWNVEPETLRWAPWFIWNRYKKPVVICENGLSNTDWISLDGKVHDPNRIDFTQRYLLQLEKAIDQGADIPAYFHWSLMDNFEWAEGYKERFGLIFVDYETGTRTLKDSAHWYSQLIASNGAILKK